MTDEIVKQLKIMNRTLALILKQMRYIPKTEQNSQIIRDADTHIENIE